MMRWHKYAIALAVGMLAVPGNSCGPFFTEIVFVNATAPSDIDTFLSGHLGVVHARLRPRYLALAYRMLSGTPLTAGEKVSLRPPPSPPQDQRADTVHTPATEGKDQWWQERAQITRATGDPTLQQTRTVPGQQWESYDNCLNDAFVNAARTLVYRARDHAAEKAELAEWVNGQDAVFSNCGGNGDMPAPVSKPLWLAQDRTYQIAAAHFYRSEFGPAQEIFQQIAADRNSTIRSLAGFMVGRCLLRQATLSLPDKNDDELMRKAAVQFRQVMQAGGPYGSPAKELLNFVELRVDPGKAAARLGDSITRPDLRLKQHLIDLSYVGEYKWLNYQQDARKSDLVDWILTMQGFPLDLHGPALRDQAFNHAKTRWVETGNIAWLVAALQTSHAPDDELALAAATVPAASPAWVTIQYGRLQMQPASAATCNEIEKLLNALTARHESPDTINLFTILARQKAASLQEFALLAPLEPVLKGDGDGNYGPPPTASALQPMMKQATMAGLPVNVAATKRIDEETARLLNRHLPLNELAPLVLESTWPKQLRFELAMAVWTRAVLLDRPDVARSLTPAMIAGEPGWRSWLAAYDDAATDDERHITGLLALMRFPSVRPYINAGAGREEGFAGYSVYRDNWWCADMGGDDYSTGHNFSGEYPNPNKPPAAALPAFVTSEMDAEAKQEWSKLFIVSDAPEYFGSQALAWVKTHPKDHRNSEVLGFALRAMRNGCNLEKSTALKREVFTTLHTKYAESEWARKFSGIDAENQ